MRRRLLAGRLTLTPRERPQGRFYELTATATLGTLLGSAVVSVVPPGRFAHVWQPDLRVRAA